MTADDSFPCCDHCRHGDPNNRPNDHERPCRSCAVSADRRPTNLCNCNGSMVHSLGAPGCTRSADERTPSAAQQQQQTEGTAMTTEAGPYDDVIGTDTTPVTVTFTLPAREAAYIEKWLPSMSSDDVDYLGQYDEPPTDLNSLARHIVRTAVGDAVVREWRAKHPGDAWDNKPEGGMG